EGFSRRSGHDPVVGDRRRMGRRAIRRLGTFGEGAATAWFSQLRPIEVAALVGPAPGRSALRENRRLAHTERMIWSICFNSVKSGLADGRGSKGDRVGDRLCALYRHRRLLQAADRS